MILIADSGSTKTDWHYVDSGDNAQSDSFSTQGINPFHQNDNVIHKIIQDELLPQLDLQEGDDLTVYFYGAGCTPETAPRLKAILEQDLACKAEVNSDLLGAAHALLGNNSGVACILGTGSNSCYYDGHKILKNVSPLGYILGDEGSAAYIGKRLVGDMLKNQFSQDLTDLFYTETQQTGASIIEKTYRQPLPNRFLGEISQFCQHHRDNDEIHSFLINCFKQFFVRNIKSYECFSPSKQLQVNFVGSIAWVYEDEIKEVAEHLGYEIGVIMLSPMDGLLKYYS